MGRRKVLIVGAGKAGQLLKSDIEKHHRRCEVVGFVDDGRWGRRGVLGRVSDLSAVYSRDGVDEVVIAVPSADGTLIRNVLLNSLRHRLPIRIVPREQRVLLDNEVSYGAVRDLSSEDFLGRPFVKKNVGRLADFYGGKRVLITGGAGSIGSEIVRQLIELEVAKVVVYDVSEQSSFFLEQQLQEMGVRAAQYDVVIGSVVNEGKVRSVVRRFRPDVIFHAAAYKHVHLMESNVDEAVVTNVLGTKSVVDAAGEARVPKLVVVSTDKAVNPRSVMGASKKIAECYVQSQTKGKTVISIVRFGNVINSQGSVLPLWEMQVRDRRCITLTEPAMRRYFMSVREAAQLVLTSGLRSSPGAIYVLNMGDLIRIDEVAKCFIRSKNLLPQADVTIKIIGRRKGEKIKEELFTRQERAKVKRTREANIWQLRGKGQCPGGMDDVVERLKRLSTGSRGALLSYLRTLFSSLK